MSSIMIGRYDTWVSWWWVLQGKVPKNTLKITKSSFAAVIQYVYKCFDTVFHQKVKSEEKIIEIIKNKNRNRYAGSSIALDILYRIIKNNKIIIMIKMYNKINYN